MAAMLCSQSFPRQSPLLDTRRRSAAAGGVGSFCRPICRGDGMCAHELTVLRLCARGSVPSVPYPRRVALARKLSRLKLWLALSLLARTSSVVLASLCRRCLATHRNRPLGAGTRGMTRRSRTPRGLPGLLSRSDLRRLCLLDCPPVRQGGRILRASRPLRYISLLARLLRRPCRPPPGGGLRCAQVPWPSGPPARPRRHRVLSQSHLPRLLPPTPGLSCLWACRAALMWRILLVRCPQRRWLSLLLRHRLGSLPSVAQGLWGQSLKPARAPPRRALLPRGQGPGRLREAYPWKCLPLTSRSSHLTWRSLLAWLRGGPGRCLLPQPVSAAPTRGAPCVRWRRLAR